MSKAIKSALAEQMDASFIRELEEDMRKHRMDQLWKRFGKAFTIGGTVVVLATVGYVWWQGDMMARNQQASSQLAQTLQQLTDSNGQDIAAKLSEQAQAMPSALAALTQFYAAGINPSDSKALEAVRANSAVAPLYRDLASLLLIQQQVGQQGSDAAKLVADLAPLRAEGQPWRFSALELTGLLQMELNDNTSAKATLETLRDSKDAPAAMRQRAAALLSQLPE